MKFKLFLSAILVTIIVLGFSHPVFAPPADPDISVSPGVKNVYVGRTFQITIVISNLPDPMIGFDFEVTWDTTLMELVGWDNFCDDRGWFHNENPVWCAGEYIRYELEGDANGAGPISSDLEWAILTFKCLGEGTSDITIHSSNTIDFDGYSISPDIFNGVCNQQLPSRVQRLPVGGVLTPSNKLMILAPYLTLIGLLAAVTKAAVVVKRRRKT
jgi:hypothetical protein